MSPRRWRGLAVLLVAAFMDLLDGSVVNVAAPAVHEDLGATYGELQWIIAGYTLACAVTLVTGGRLGDILGRRRMFLAGTAGFTAASALCALAPTAETLVGARVLQGCTAGLMLPQILAIIHVTFAGHELGRVVALYAVVAGLAMTGGPVAGGLLVDGLRWRGVFALNVPVGLLALAAAPFCLAESRTPRSRRLDIMGSVLVTAGLLALVLPLVTGRPLWSAASLPVFAVFVWHERRKDRRDGSPLVVLGLFRARAFSLGLVAQLCCLCVPAAFFLTLTVHLQLGLGWSPSRTGLTTVPFALAASAGGAVSTRLFPRYGRVCLPAGATMMAAGVLLCRVLVDRYGAELTAVEMIAPMVLVGAGLGQVVVPLTALTIADVPAPHAGAASGIINTVAQLGSVLGVALIGTVFFTALGHETARAADRALPYVRGELSAAPERVREPALAGFRSRVTDTAKPGTAPLPSPAARTVAAEVTRARREGFTGALRRTSWFIAGVLALLTALLVALRP